MMNSSPFFMHLLLSKNCRYNSLLHIYVRQYAKKYNYNLNDLLDWKKKTNLAFGSPRKLTKTGKLRKSKNNENQQLLSTLETLSAQSAHGRHASGNENHLVSNSNGKLYSMSVVDDIPNEFFGEVPLPCGKTSMGTSTSGSAVLKGSNVMTEPPDDLLRFDIDFPTEMFSCVRQSKYLYLSNDDQLLCDLDEETDHYPNSTKWTSQRKKASDNDEINFPVLSPMPSSTGSNHIQRKNKGDNVFPSSVTSPIPLSNKNNDVDYSSKRGTSDDNDIHIPVLSPIPSNASNDITQKSYNVINDQRRSKSKSKISESKKLPLEPPGSFDLINEVLLRFEYQSASEEVQEKILKFKSDVDSLSLRTMPAVKSILNKTMPDLNRFFLNRWREGMIKDLGEQGFKAHQDATIKRGINFHANVMELLSGKSETEIQIMPDNEGHWVSLQTAMRHISGVEVLEEAMRHPALLYRGVLDCVAKYKDVLCVIDWKTSKRPRPLLKNTYDDPLQVAAYMGLVNADPRMFNQLGGVNHGLLVVIYPDGSPAHIHLMNKGICERYWQDWQGRLYHYYQLVYTEKMGTTTG